MSTQEQGYYEFLVRTDHPVHRKDFSEPTDSSAPFNVLFNRVLARQFVKMRAEIDRLRADSFPHLTTDTGIDEWEESRFGFVKSGFDLPTRIAQLLTRINTRIGMRVSDVIALAQAITGLTPIVIRNLYFDGWILDQGALDYTTALAGGDQSAGMQVYLVGFLTTVDSTLLAQLDNQLKQIEKGGCMHFITAFVQPWVLDQSILDVTTILG